MDPSTTELAEVPAIEREIHALRERTEELIGELEHRFRSEFQAIGETVKLAEQTFRKLKEVRNRSRQIMRNPLVFGGVVVGMAALFGLAVMRTIRARVRRRGFVAVSGRRIRGLLR